MVDDSWQAAGIHWKLQKIGGLWFRNRWFNNDGWEMNVPKMLEFPIYNKKSFVSPTDVDSFLNLTSDSKDKSNENDHITLIVDSDSSFSVNDTESGFEDDNVLCEISQNRRDNKSDGFTAKDTNNKCNSSNNNNNNNSNNNNTNSDNRINKESQDEDDEDFVDKRKRRHRNPQNWKVNIQKNARLRGLEYIGIGGKKFRIAKTQLFPSYD